jgi:hypothetical protein
MARPKKLPAQIINYWAPRLGLDPRAVRTVARGEGGLEWGRTGDGGHAFGPFQMNDAGGVLTGRFGSSQARSAFANSEAGMVEAMRAMAKAGARGQSGMEAVSTIISKYERPADIPGSIARARKNFGTDGGAAPPTNPRHIGGAEQSMGSSPVFGLDASTSGVDAQRKAAGDFFRSRAMARIQGAAVPGITDLATTLRTIRRDQNQEGAAPYLKLPNTPVKPQGEIPSSARPKGGGDMPFVLQAGNQALAMGLSVRENPYYDKVDPVHTEGSDHYRTAGTYRGKQYGAALDVSGDPEKQKRFFKWLEANRGRGLDDAFHDPMGYSYDEGNRWGKTIGGHGKHVHASFK